MPKKSSPLYTRNPPRGKFCSLFRFDVLPSALFFIFLRDDGCSCDFRNTRVPRKKGWFLRPVPVIGCFHSAHFVRRRRFPYHERLHVCIFCSFAVDVGVVRRLGGVFCVPLKSQHRHGNLHGKGPSIPKCCHISVSS